MSKVRLSETEEIVAVCSVLSNRKKTMLLKYIHETGKVTVREVYEDFSAEIGLSHRETTHKYLEDLVDAGILKKEKSADGEQFEYTAELDEVHICL